MEREISRAQKDSNTIIVDNVVKEAVTQLTELSVAPSAQEVYAMLICMVTNVSSQIEKVVDRRLWLHDADKTGKPDYALMSAGARIIRY